MEDLFLPGIVVIARSVSFPTFSVPEMSLGTGSHKENQAEIIQYKPAVRDSSQQEAAALKSHISLPSHTLQSHCSSINPHYPAIWSPSSHSETQTPPTRIDLTRTSPMYKGPSVISLPCVSFYKHGLIYAHTWNT